MRPIDADALTEKYGDWYVEEGPEEGFIGTLGQLLSGQSEINCSDIPNNSDTISRQQAIDEAEKWFFNLKDKRRVSEVLKDLPSVQPETAKRIVGKSRDGMTLWYQCDTCNEPVDAQDNYCRGCGRRLMEGEWNDTGRNDNGIQGKC